MLLHFLYNMWVAKTLKRSEKLKIRNYNFDNNCFISAIESIYFSQILYSIIEDI